MKTAINHTQEPITIINNNVLSGSQNNTNDHLITNKTLIELLASSIFVLEIYAREENKITFHLSTDQRGTELFVNKLIEIDSDVYKANFNVQNLNITIEVPEKKYSEVQSDFNYAFSKLNKYVEYKDLIAKFAPGYPNRAFPGYSFEDFDISYNGFTKMAP